MKHLNSFLNQEVVINPVGSAILGWDGIYGLVKEINPHGVVFEITEVKGRQQDSIPAHKVGDTVFYTFASGLRMRLKRPEE